MTIYYKMSSNFVELLDGVDANKGLRPSIDPVLHGATHLNLDGFALGMNLLDDGHAIGRHDAVVLFHDSRMTIFYNLSSHEVDLFLSSTRVCTMLRIDS